MMMSACVCVTENIFVDSGLFWGLHVFTVSKIMAVPRDKPRVQENDFLT